LKRFWFENPYRGYYPHVEVDHQKVVELPIKRTCTAYYEKSWWPAKRPDVVLLMKRRRDDEDRQE
jgi:hypothetical protein